MYKFLVTWNMPGVQISVPVTFDDETITDIALDGLDPVLVGVIGDRRPFVTQA